MSTQHSKSYIKYSWFLVGMVFLVILAGGVVRMTQSGMGCPDWPTCFGKWIPPTDASQLPADFEKYLDKQDIDTTFNVYHTWIEYINRLLGALLGIFIAFYVLLTCYKFGKNSKRISINLFYIFGSIAVLISLYAFSGKLVIGLLALVVGAIINFIYFSFKFSSRKDLLFLAYVLFVAVAFQGYLGKVVVDENLSVIKITIHMIGALVIAALPLISITRLQGDRVQVSKLVKHLSTGLVVLVLLQIILGTQVREEIDVISKSLAYEQRELWIGMLSVIFVIHRSFSWLVLVGYFFLYWKMKDYTEHGTIIRRIGFSIFIIIVLGIVMTYLDMPAIAQPLHLLLACVLLMQLLYSRLILYSNN